MSSDEEPRSRTEVLRARFAGEVAVARDQYRRARRRPLGVRARLRALEAEVQENRRLNRRIAELTDVVAELLVPLHQRDEERVAELLAAYRRGI